MPFIAQMPAATPDQVGNAVVTIAAIGVFLTSLLAGANQAKKLFGWGEKKYGDVSREDLEHYAKNSRVDEIAMELKDLRTYAHNEIHQIRDMLNRLTWKLETLIILLRQRLKLPVDDSGMGSKFDEPIG